MSSCVLWMCFLISPVPYLLICKIRAMVPHTMTHDYLICVQTFSEMPENNIGITITLSLRLNILTFPREEDVLKSLVFGELACCTVKKSYSFANMFPRVGGSWFSCYILSVEGSADGSAPHMGCPEGRGLHIVWLWEAWPLVLCVPSVCWSCFCLWFGLSASYSTYEEPHCLF